jgi:3-oxoacyl-[acyl-carrier protein] reductase
MNSIDLGLEGKRIIVSGAGHERAGHGKLTSLRLAAAGARIACIDWDVDRAKSVVSDIQSSGGEAHAIVADMTDRGVVAQAVADASTYLGGLDGCVDIIGSARWQKVEDITDEHWHWAIQHNVTQVFYLYQEVAQHLIKQGTGGSMVSIASVDGIVAAAYHAPYGAAKAAVMSLTKTFAFELGRYGIRVNSVAPGNVGAGNEDQPDGEYDVNGINPLAAPRARDIANAILFLTSELAARITGQTLIVDGGATIKELWHLTPDVVPAL